MRRRSGLCVSQRGQVDEWWWRAGTRAEERVVLNVPVLGEYGGQVKQTSGFECAGVGRVRRAGEADQWTLWSGWGKEVRGYGDGGEQERIAVRDI